LLRLRAPEGNANNCAPITNATPRLKRQLLELRRSMADTVEHQ
jgi:hypothetical protein